MRRLRIWFTTILLLLTPLISLPLLAQDLEGHGSPRALDLSGKVHPGERIFVTDQNGVQTEGRLLRMSPRELTLEVAGKDRTIPSDRIGRIEKRDSIWNGMLIGAVPAALIGAAAAGSSCSPHCSRDVAAGTLVLGLLGAGIGAAVDAGVPGYAIVHGAAVSSPNALGSPVPVTSVDALWLRVRQGDTIEVTTSNGQKTTGHFAQVSDTFLTLDVRGVRQEIASSSVRRVTRAGNRYRSGALWGGVIAGAMGLIGSAACRGNGCGNAVVSTVFLSAAGAVWGTAIGAAIPKHPAVYDVDASSSTVRVQPVVGRGRVGVAFTLTF